MVLQGLADLRSGTVSPAACLVDGASQWLRDLGLELPESGCLPAERELTLYQLLPATAEDGYCRYNTVLRELDSLTLLLRPSTAPEET
ncbi:MAG: hypothetical protein IT186_20960 [Acidobacteria bacterium]|nr:hypothetical protein [Acidobacteriota bacterium]